MNYPPDDNFLGAKHILQPGGSAVAGCGAYYQPKDQGDLEMGATFYDPDKPANHPVDIPIVADISGAGGNPYRLIPSSDLRLIEQAVKAWRARCYLEALAYEQDGRADLGARSLGMARMCEGLLRRTQGGAA